MVHKYQRCTHQFRQCCNRQTLVTVGSLVVLLFLVPVYIFMLLYYHPILLEFIHRFFGTSNQSQVSEIVTQTKTVIQRYLAGLVIEAAIVATLNSVALLILGIEYAILLGIIGALLNIIPYIGGINRSGNIHGSCISLPNPGLCTLRYNDLLNHTIY